MRAAVILASMAACLAAPSWHIVDSDIATIDMGAWVWGRREGEGGCAVALRFDCAVWACCVSPRTCGFV